MVDLSTEYVGLKLRTPLLAAAAGTTGTVERLRRAEAAGVGAVVLKSYFEKSVCREAPTPRYHLIRHGRGAWRSFSFYSYEQASELDLAGYAAFVREAKASLEIPVIASLNCFTEAGWREAALAVAEAGADAVELNLSCPHGVHLMGEHDVIAEMVATTRLVKGLINIPIIPKMTPQSSNPLAVAKSLEEAGADALVIFNRLTGLEIDLETERPVMHGGYAGHGGPWAIQYPLRWITGIYPQIRIPISGSGGVMSGEDVAKYILAGACTVQVCTAIYLEGYEVIRKINQGLGQFMERKGYQNLGEWRGKVAGRILTMEEVDRRHILAARVDPAQCTGCALCTRICLFGAIEMRGGKAEVDLPLCDGCGLCVEVCPVRAISLERIQRGSEI